MPGTLPPCPINDSDYDSTHSVRNISGAGGERRTYICACGHVWTQTRPDALKEDEDPRVVATEQCFRVFGGQKRGTAGSGYRCGKCGQIKVGHVCQQATNKSARPPAAPSLAPPPTAPSAELVASSEPTAPSDLAGSIATGVGFGDAMRSDGAGDATADMRVLLSAPFTAAQYLAFLEKYDLRPSQAAHMKRTIQAQAAVRIQHFTHGVREHTRAYLARIDDEVKSAHRKLLETPDKRELLIANKNGLPVALLLFVSGRRGSVDLVHTLREHRENGHARLLAEHVKTLVPPHGSVTIDSPWCTARAAIVLWLSVGFIGDEDLLKSTLRDNSAYDRRDTNRSVRVTLLWRADISETTRLLYLRRVVEAHPELSRLLSNRSM